MTNQNEHNLLNTVFDLKSESEKTATKQSKFSAFFSSKRGKITAGITIGVIVAGIITATTLFGTGGEFQGKFVEIDQKKDILKPENIIEYSRFYDGHTDTSDAQIFSYESGDKACEANYLGKCLQVEEWDGKEFVYSKDIKCPTTEVEKFKETKYAAKCEKYKIKVKGLGPDNNDVYEFASGDEACETGSSLKCEKMTMQKYIKKGEDTEILEGAGWEDADIGCEISDKTKFKYAEYNAVCIKKVGIGKGCLKDKDCIKELVCGKQDGSTTLKCWKPIDSFCETNNDCLSKNCIKNNCKAQVIAAEKATPTPAPAPAPEPGEKKFFEICEEGDTCEPGTVCDGYPTWQDKQKRCLGEEGHECGGIIECIVGYKCENNICVNPASNPKTEADKPIVKRIGSQTDLSKYLYNSGDHACESLGLKTCSSIELWDTTYTEASEWRATESYDAQCSTQKGAYSAGNAYRAVCEEPTCDYLKNYFKQAVTEMNNDNVGTLIDAKLLPAFKQLKLISNSCGKLEDHAVCKKWSKVTANTTDDYTASKLKYMLGNTDLQICFEANENPQNCKGTDTYKYREYDSKKYYECTCETGNPILNASDWTFTCSQEDCAPGTDCEEAGPTLTCKDMIDEFNNTVKTFSLAMKAAESLADADKLYVEFSKELGKKLVTIKQKPDCKQEPNHGICKEYVEAVLSYKNIDNYDEETAKNLYSLALSNNYPICFSKEESVQECEIDIEYKYQKGLEEGEYLTGCSCPEGSYDNKNPDWTFSCLALDKCQGEGPFAKDSCACPKDTKALTVGQKFTCFDCAKLETELNTLYSAMETAQKDEKIGNFEEAKIAFSEKWNTVTSDQKSVCKFTDEDKYKNYNNLQEEEKAEDRCEMAKGQIDDIKRKIDAYYMGTESDNYEISDFVNDLYGMELKINELGKIEKCALPEDFNEKDYLPFTCEMYIGLLTDFETYLIKPDAKASDMKYLEADEFAQLKAADNARYQIDQLIAIYENDNKYHKKTCEGLDIEKYKTKTCDYFDKELKTATAGMDAILNGTSKTENPKKEYERLQAKVVQVLDHDMILSGNDCAFDYDSYKAKPYVAYVPPVCADYKPKLEAAKTALNAATTKTAHDTAQADMLAVLKNVEALNDSKCDVAEYKLLAAKIWVEPVDCALKYNSQFTFLKTNIQNASSQVSANMYISQLGKKIAEAKADKCTVTADTEALLLTIPTLHASKTACTEFNSDFAIISQFIKNAKSPAEMEAYKAALQQRMQDAKDAGCEAPINLIGLLVAEFVDNKVLEVTDPFLLAQAQAQVLGAQASQQQAQYVAVQQPATQPTTQSQTQPQAQQIQPMGMGYGVPQAQPGVYGYAQIPASTGPKSTIYLLVFLGLLTGGYLMRKKLY